jgi:hypothetical protein
MSRASLLGLTENAGNAAQNTLSVALSNTSSIEETMGKAATDGLLKLGMSPERAEFWGPMAAIVPQFAPFVGAGVGIDNTARAINKGDYGEAALEAGLTVLGEVPIFGDLAAKGIKSVLGRGGDAAKELPDGALGIFAGRNSKTANPKAAESILEVKPTPGGSPQVLAEKQRSHSSPHGQEWFTGADGMPRYEISDHDAVFYDLDDQSFVDLAKETVEDASGLSREVDLGMAEDVLSHDSLWDAYPELGKSRVIAADLGETTRAGYNRKTGDIYLNPAKLNEEDAASAMLHELQHGIQQKEGFSLGAGAEGRSIKDWSQRTYSQDADFDRLRYESAKDDLIASSGAERVMKYRKYAENPPRPGEISKHSAWYEHSDTIRDKYGPMPKKAGAERDEWQRQAWTYLANVEEGYVRNYGTIPAMSKAEGLLDTGDLKKAQSDARKAERKLKKHRDGAVQADQWDKKKARIERMGDRQRYEQAGGEVEARATQARMKLTPEERRARPIFEDYTAHIFEGKRPAYPREKGLLDWKDIIE